MEEGRSISLADELRALADRSRADLNDEFDYYMDSRVAWRFVHQIVAGGTKFVHRNPITGTETTQRDLTRKARQYVKKQLVQATFQQFISIFENYFFDLLALWLNTYPHSLSSKQVEFRTILAAPDKNAITQHVVGNELNALLYERPASWFEYLERKVKLGCPTADEIERFAEAKASRDVLIHNRGVANQVYLLKAGKLARCSFGERLDIPAPYHRATWDLLQKMVSGISNAAISKVAGSVP